MFIDMKQLDELLARIEDHIDLEHCQKVDERYRKSLSCEDLCSHPITKSLHHSHY